MSKELMDECLRDAAELWEARIVGVPVINFSPADRQATATIAVALYLARRGGRGATW